MNPQISIIVPVYKAEAYIHRCIDSLLAQTFHDFEVLLIDDGSPDMSGEICDEYAKKDNHIRVFHKQNGGVSSARQLGIDNALGMYVIHADPDDWVEPKMLEELYNKIKEDDSDVVICDYWEDDNNVRKYINQKPSSLENKILLNDILTQRIHGSCCNKLVKRSCYDLVKFPVGLNYSEDTYVILHIIHNGVKISYLPKAFYHYCLDTNPSSIMKGPKNRLYYQAVSFLEKIKLICPVSEYKEGYAVQYADLSIRAFCCNIYTLSNLKIIISKWEKDYHINDKLSIFWKILFFLAFKCRMYNFLYRLIVLKRKI